MPQRLEDLSEARRFQLLIDSVVDYAIFMLDAESNVLTWNSGAERLKGYAPHEIIGQHFSRFYTPEDLSTNLPARALCVAKEAGRFHGEGWRIRKDGERFWTMVVIDAIRDEYGELIGYAKVTRDITERQHHHLESGRRAETFSGIWTIGCSHAKCADRTHHSPAGGTAGRLDADRHRHARIEWPLTREARS